MASDLKPLFELPQLISLSSPDPDHNSCTKGSGRYNVCSEGAGSENKCSNGGAPNPY